MMTSKPHFILGMEFRYDYPVFESTPLETNFCQVVELHRTSSTFQLRCGIQTMAVAHSQRLFSHHPQSARPVLAVRYSCFEQKFLFRGASICGLKSSNGV
jgi:hypothetical protein